MFQSLRDDTKYLYHYTSIDKAVNYILKNRTLMFNSLRGTNDPKESKNWKFDFHIEGKLSPTHKESTTLWKDVSEEIKTKCKVLCFSKDIQDLGKDMFNDIYKRGFAKPRMWAQYGDNHKGLCLIFERKQIENLLMKQFGQSGDIYHRDIKYTNSPLKGDVTRSPYTLHYPLLQELGIVEYVKRHIYTYNTELIFEKSLDWRDENEYRFLMHIDRLENQFLLFENALKGIVFGTDTSDEHQRDVFQLMNKESIQFEKISYSNSTPGLSYKDFRQFQS